MCRYAGELHSHTNYSVYDGFGKIEEHVKYAKELGHTSQAITDHGTMSGCVEHYFACLKEGIRPILGVEAYFQITFDSTKKYYHITLLAQNNIGYANLCHMMSEAAEHQSIWQGGKSAASRRFIPILTFEQFEKYSEGVILLSGCIGGTIPQLILSDKKDIALRLLEGFADIFGDNFYLEVMPYPVMEDGYDIQQVVNAQLVVWGKEYHLPVVLTSDKHYAKKEQYPTYLKMYELAKSKMIADYTNLYLHNEEDQMMAWKRQMGTDATPYLETTLQIAEKCNIELPFTDTRPHVDWGEPSQERLLRLAEAGLRAKGLWDWDEREETYLQTTYAKQLLYEIDVICHTGYDDYFLTVEDYLDFMRKRNIRCTARGSVNGSLLAHALGISEVNPIRRKTVFPRFMRYDKVVVDPDIDMDVQSNRRHEGFDYILEKYAGRAVAISNFTYWTTKSLCNELVKTYPDMIVFDQKRIKDALLVLDYDKAPIGYERLMEDQLYGTFFKEFEERYENFILHFCSLHGQLKQFGQHAAGIAITNKEVWNYMPVFRVAKSQTEEGYAIQTAYNMAGISDIALMKYDVLGVKELTQRAEVEEATGCSYSDDLIDDPEIYQWFREGRTEAVFQSSSAGAKRMYAEIGVENFIELCAAISMNRPGPYQSGLFEKYLAGKKGDVDRSLPWYSICEETHGNIVYQEQAMYICRELAGMSWPHTDKFVKGISKKKIMPELEHEFLQGLQDIGGLSLEQAQKLYDGIKLYSFNKNHAVGYAQVAAYGMWMKIHHTHEFYSAALKRENMSEKYRPDREQLETAALRDGVRLLTPHINGSANYQIIEGGGKKYIQIGLCTIDGIGPGAAEALNKYGPYDGPENMSELSEEELLLAWQKHLKEKGVPSRNATSKIVKALYDAGALQMNTNYYLGASTSYCFRIQDDWSWKQNNNQFQKKRKTA